MAGNTVGFDFSAFRVKGILNSLYYQDCPPVGGQYDFGDRWYDTSDNYKLYIFTGSRWEHLCD